MNLLEIIRQHKNRLQECGLTAELRFFQSENIKAIYYQGHIALSSGLTTEEAHEVLHSAYIIANSPAHIGRHVTQHLDLMFDDSVALWGPRFFSQSSKNEELRGGYLWKKLSEQQRTYASANRSKNLTG